MEPTKRKPGRPRKVAWLCYLCRTTGTSLEALSYHLIDKHKLPVLMGRLLPSDRALRREIARRSWHMTRLTHQAKKLLEAATHHPKP